MIHRKILRQCGEEVTTRTKIGSSWVNLKTKFNTPWKDSVDKNPKGSSHNLKYESADTISKFYICQSTTDLSNTGPKRGKINEINIEEESDVEKHDVIEANSNDKSSIFSEYSKDIENINVTFDIMESYSHLPQLRNSQLDLSKIQDAQLKKTKPNREKGYTAGNSCITEVTNYSEKITPVNLELEKFKSEQLNEAEISLHLSDKQENELSALLYDHKEAFASVKEPLGAIIGHEAEITLNIERPYPPLPRRPAYPESPKSREAREMHITKLLNLVVIKNVGHNEEVEITTPVIVAWNNGKYRMVGDFRALNNYTVPDRYPIPKIQISPT
ncbi:hypothetical protein O181_066933 [Austropuccinia psidii MF-1]|uniref:Uncharacterized protein n=1 Tax=Austropuccinia psidii MF-1 TaxID=1389203 RepID=A0A9Q3EXY9_9BASI|nr:hypothetical protein [Austropuccinia psidii MF-1]